MTSTGYLKQIFFDSRFKFAVFQTYSKRNGNHLRLGHMACKKGLVKDTGFGHAVCGGCRTELHDAVGITCDLNLDHPLMDSEMVSIWVRIWLKLEREDLTVKLDWD